MNVKTETVTAPVLRRVTLELPVERAVALADVLMNHLTWDETAAEDDIAALYGALKRGDSTSEEN